MGPPAAPAPALQRRIRPMAPTGEPPAPPRPAARRGQVRAGRAHRSAAADAAAAPAAYRPLLRAQSARRRARRRPALRLWLQTCAYLGAALSACPSGVGAQSATAEETITATLNTVTESVSVTETYTLRTATATGQITATLPTQTQTDGISATLPTFTTPITVTLPTSTQTHHTFTLPTTTVTYTLPSVTPSRIPTSSATLPTRTPTETATVSMTLTLPTGGWTVTETMTLPDATATKERTITLPTVSGSQTREVTLPTFTDTLTFSETLTLPSAALTGTVTATLPTSSDTVSATVTLNSATGTRSLPETLTLPSMTVTTSETVTLPSRTESVTTTFTLVTVSETLTESITLPTGTTTITLPTFSDSATVSITLPSTTGTPSPSMTLPTTTDTRTETHEITATLPTETLTDTQTFSSTLPTATLSQTETFTLKTATGTASYTISLPTLSTTLSTSMTLPTFTPTETESATTTLPSESNLTTSTARLPTGTWSNSATFTMPSQSVTQTETVEATDTATRTVTLPTSTETPQNYAPVVTCNRIGGNLRDYRDAQGRAPLLADTNNQAVPDNDTRTAELDGEQLGDKLMYQTSGAIKAPPGWESIWAYIGDTVRCTIDPPDFSVLSTSMYIGYHVTMGTSMAGSPTALRYRQFNTLRQRYWLSHNNSVNSTQLRLPQVPFRKDDGDSWHPQRAGEVILGDNGSTPLLAANTSCLQTACGGNATRCKLSDCPLVSTGFDVGYPCHVKRSPFLAPDRIWATYEFKVTAIDLNKKTGREVVDGQWFDGTRIMRINTDPNRGVELFLQLDSGAEYPSRGTAPGSELIGIPMAEATGVPGFEPNRRILQARPMMTWVEGMQLQILAVQLTANGYLRVHYEVVDDEITDTTVQTTKVIRSMAYAASAVLATKEKKVDVHYLYGTPLDFSMECPGPDARLHAWSVTRANMDPACDGTGGLETCGPVGEANVAEGHMAYCYARGIAPGGLDPTRTVQDTVLPDPAHGQYVDVTSQAGYLAVYGASNPQSALCTQTGLSTCDPPVLQVGRVQYAVTSLDANDQQVQKVIAPAIPWIINVMTPAGPRTRFAYEPQNFGQSLINFRLMDSVTAAVEQRIIKVGGSLQKNKGWKVECVPETVDPLFPAVGTQCRVKDSGDVSNPQPAFADDLFVSDQQAAEPTPELATLLNFTNMVKRNSRSQFARWSNTSDPGFQFDFIIYPMLQPKTYDGRQVTLFLNWRNVHTEPAELGDPRTNKSYSEAFAAAGCSGFRNKFTYIDLFQFTVSIQVAATPNVTFTCNGQSCGGDQIAYFPQTIFSSSGSVELSTPLVINPYLYGPGVTSVSFQQGAKAWCWTSEQYMTPTEIEVRGICLPGTGADRLQQFSVTSAGALIVRRLPQLQPADNIYKFKLRLGQQLKTPGEVIVKYNTFQQVGTISAPLPAAPSPFTPIDVFCQDFADSDAPLSVWVESWDPEDQTWEVANSVWPNYQFGAYADSSDMVHATAFTVADAVQMAGITFEYLRLDQQGEGSTQQVSLAGATAHQDLAANSPRAFSAKNLIDGDPTTKWLDYNRQPVVVTLAGPARADRYTWSTGDGDPHRDPVQWRLEGSTDAAKWVTLHEQRENFAVTLERSVNVNGSAVTAWFPIDPWQTVYPDSPCGGCTLVGAMETFDTLEQCQFLCQRTCSDAACLFVGCTHINYNRTSRGCQRLDCTGNTARNLTRANTHCMSLTATIKYFRFTPTRFRETPLKVFLSNPTQLAYNRTLRCMVEDALGAQVWSRNTVEVSVEPMYIPRTRSGTDDYLTVLGLLLNTTHQSFDRLVAAAHVIENLVMASGLDLLEASEKIMDAFDARLEQYRTRDIKLSPVTSTRVSTVLKELAEIVNTRISPQDTSVADLQRLLANQRLVESLLKLSSPTQSRRLAKDAGQNIMEALGIVAEGLQMFSQAAVPGGVRAARRAEAASRRAAATSAANDTKAVLRQTTDQLLEAMCQLGGQIFSSSGGGAFVGGCVSCDYCPLFGAHMTVCVDTAWDLRGKEIIVGSAASTGNAAIKFARDAADTPVQNMSQFIRVNATHRADLESPLAMVAFQMGVPLRGYDSDAVLLRGSPAYFCLLNHSQYPHLRRPLNVTATNFELTVQLNVTDRDRVPVAIARRNQGDWELNGCRDDASKFVNASASSSGVVTETCSQLSVAPLPAEFAAVQSVTAQRCTPGDVTGCVAVENPDTVFRDCRCVLCTDRPRSLPERLAAPNGYYVTPIADGKVCVPYQNFTCTDTEQVQKKKRPPYIALVQEQCGGGSVLAGRMCACTSDKVCALGLCEGKLQCNDTGSGPQCRAAGYHQDESTLACSCGARAYCKNVTIAERQAEASFSVWQLNTTLGAALPPAAARSFGEWVAEWNRQIAGMPTKRECVQLIDCVTSTTGQEVTDPGACTNGTHYHRRLRQCTCPPTSYCDTQTRHCLHKARCGERPVIPSADRCWPVDGGQPQLQLTTNRSTGISECSCPDSLQCDPETRMCTCPMCLNGGVCDWPSTRAAQDLHPHTCFCGEGYLGPTCAKQEPKEDQYVTVRYPGANYSSYQSMSAASKAKMESAVRAGVMAELAKALKNNATHSNFTNTTRPRASVNDINIKAVYFLQGSLVVNVLLSVWPSTWSSGASASMSQAQVGVTISQELANQLSSGDLSALGDLTTPAVAGILAQCNAIDHCTLTPAPWDQCRCTGCDSGYTVHPGWTTVGGAINQSIKGYSCIKDDLCTNAEDCNNRGSASGIRAIQCQCTCAPDFSGSKCENDSCLVSFEAWLTPGCGPRRCSFREDGSVLVEDTPGSPAGLCKAPVDTSLAQDEVAAIIVSVLLVACFAFGCTFYAIHQKCPWERLTGLLSVEEEGSDDEAEEHGKDDEHAVLSPGEKDKADEKKKKVELPAAAVEADDEQSVDEESQDDQADGDLASPGESLPLKGSGLGGGGFFTSPQQRFQSPLLPKSGPSSFQTKGFFTSGLQSGRKKSGGGGGTGGWFSGPSSFKTQKSQPKREPAESIMMDVAVAPLVESPGSPEPGGPSFGGSPPQPPAAAAAAPPAAEGAGAAAAAGPGPAEGAAAPAGAAEAAPR
eukprot:TRINITY_DN11232_c0_g5_i1.p1 TRINITY_DN11232_c0_g5~~TRINITY_DN11232_c0_g5_i1.p1  ORF type:complete len:3081 (+),score=677.88 TRINITY_DN11232_c0_g5_i1:151-9393(+)